MISLDIFTKKIQEIAHLKCISITKVSVETAYSRFQSQEIEDLDKAIDQVLKKEDRFDFLKLLKEISSISISRRETDSQQSKYLESQNASAFFHPKYTGECTLKSCNPCQHKRNCKHRTYEWLKGINTIMSSPKFRPKGEGQAMAEEFIRFMRDEFMGETK
jgi:hypothetical protein